LKDNIHPKSGKTLVIDTKGNKIELISCLSSTGKTYQLAVDHSTHPAWTGNSRMISSAGNVQKLIKKFKGFDEL
jgi:large subunit ribosomal protein L31